MAEAQIRVCWLSGNLHERKLILEKIKGQLSDCEREIYDECSYPYFEEKVYTPSVFGGRRLLIVNQLPTPSGTKQTMINHLKKLLDDIPDDCVIVFNGVDSEPIQKHVAKVGKVFAFDDKIEKDNAAFWVMKQFEERGKVIAEDDAKKLVDMGGFDKEVNGIGLDTLMVAVDKVTQYLGRRKNVTAEDVVVNSFPSEEFVVWTIFDALDSKELERCLTVMHQMFKEEGGSDGGVSKLLPLVLWRYRLLFFLKEALAKGLTKQQATAEAKELLKLQQNGETFHITLSAEIDGERKPAYTDYWIGREINGQYGRSSPLDNYSRKELVRIVQCIQESLVESRSRTTEAAKGLLGDLLMFTVCSAMDDIHLDTLRDSHGD